MNSVLMHMADGLISVNIGVIFMIISFIMIGFSIKKINQEYDDRKIPLMGVMGAFIFAAQMINFTIPGTGSSGHIGGGILLCLILGQYPAFLSLCSVLIIQCLFFGDGGLLALGCNIFNMFFRIILPMIRPAIATSCIFAFLNTWNELLFANTFVDSSQYKTLPVGIMSFVGEHSTNWGIIGAGMVIATLPTVVIYLLLSKQVQESFTVGAVKG